MDPIFAFYQMFFLSMCVNGPIVAFGKDICFSSFLFKINGSNSYEWGLFPPNWYVIDPIVAFAMDFLFLSENNCINILL